MFFAKMEQRVVFPGRNKETSYPGSSPNKNDLLGQIGFLDPISRYWSIVTWQKLVDCDSCGSVKSALLLMGFEPLSVHETLTSVCIYGCKLSKPHDEWGQPSDVWIVWFWFAQIFAFSPILMFWFFHSCTLLCGVHWALQGKCWPVSDFCLFTCWCSTFSILLSTSSFFNYYYYYFLLNSISKALWFRNILFFLLCSSCNI